MTINSHINNILNIMAITFLELFLFFCGFYFNENQATILNISFNHKSLVFTWYLHTVGPYLTLRRLIQ